MSIIDDMRYDAWKTSPPEEEDIESDFKCDKCGEDFYPDDPVFDIEGECLCEECAKDWLYERMSRATYEDCFKES
jgi:formylmethanofuran dehydrogenase subunit E